jgi:sugar/nucleoside kinase (ribokinase family)
MSNPGKATRGGQHWDYTTVGHVTADVFADGSRQAGGGAFYSALQAARLGLSARIITRGVAAEIGSLLEPYSSELELVVLPSARTTVLETLWQGTQRTQRLLSWAGPMGERVDVDTAILHLAPVAHETGARWHGQAGFVGLTAQGLVRAWASEGAPITRVPLQEQLLPQRCDAIVISEQERESCAALFDRPGPVLVVTAAARASTLRLVGGERRTVAVPAIGTVRDDLGAGDVFAAAFFVALGEGLGAERAALFANAAAAIRIEGIGASAIGSRAQIDARMSGAG